MQGGLNMLILKNFCNNRVGKFGVSNHTIPQKQ
jgi:hypothetical protein